MIKIAGAQRFLADSDQRWRGLLRHPHHRELLGFPPGTSPSFTSIYLIYIRRGPYAGKSQSFSHLPPGGGGG